MRVKTKPCVGMNSIHLQVDKKDGDGEVYISTAFAGIWLRATDVPGLIKALKRAIA